MNRAGPYILLFIGLLLVSTSGPFLKMAAMDAFAVAFWRMLLTSVAFLLWGLATRQLSMTWSHARTTAIGGILLGLHLSLWVWAFDLTDFASNLLLLVVQPVMAALVGARLGERTTRATWIAVVLSLVGLGIIAGGDISLGPRALLGDLISIISSICMTLFYAMTREARRSSTLPAFMAVSMGSGALAVLPIVLLTGSHLIGYPPVSWGWLAALVLVTTVGGHGAMNYVARHVTLFTLNVVIVMEPPIGVAIGAPLFGASITGVQIIGGAILGAAVVVGLLPELNRRSVGEVAEIDGV